MDTGSGNIGARLHKELFSELLEIYRDSVETDLGRPVEPDDWVFWRQLGSARPWEVTALCGAIRQVFEDAGLSDVPGAGLHCLRRTWATDALAVGNSLAAVQHAGGWSTAQVLLSHYAKPRQAELEKLAESLGQGD